MHVAWLRAAIWEFRSFTIKAVDGSEISGAEILDPVWKKMVHWHAGKMHETQRPLNIATLEKTVLALKDGQSLFKQFETLVAQGRIKMNFGIFYEHQLPKPWEGGLEQ